jgi:hypothetical protein
MLNVFSNTLIILLHVQLYSNQGWDRAEFDDFTTAYQSQQISFRYYLYFPLFQGYWRQSPIFSWYSYSSLHNLSLINFELY